MSMITITSHDDKKFQAYVALPEASSAPCIIVIQEIFGVNEEMRNKCDELAACGYVAVCPDLFWRIEPNIQLTDSDDKELKRAFELFEQFNIQKGIDDLKATIDHMRGYETGNGNVGCIGYCLGGRLAYMLAAKSNIDASVSYYGVSIETMLDDAVGIRKPLLMHIAEEDQFVSKDAQEQIKNALIPHNNIKIYTYPGTDHAFARENGMHYNQQAARLANQRSYEFLKNALHNKKAA